MKEAARVFFLVEHGNPVETFLLRDIRTFYAGEARILWLRRGKAKPGSGPANRLKDAVKKLAGPALTRKISRMRHRRLAGRICKREGISDQDLLIAYWCNHVLSVAGFIRIRTGCSLEVCCHARDIFTGSYLGEVPSHDIRRYFFCCRKSMRWSIENFALDPAKVEYRPHPAETPRLHRGHGTPEFRVLNVARDVPKKNLAAVFRFVGRLNAGVERLRFLQIGADPARLGARMDAGVDACFRGHVAPEEVAEAMATSDLLLYGSRIAEDGDRDGDPNVLKEALCMGLPILAEAGWANGDFVEEGRNMVVESLDGDFTKARDWLMHTFPEKFRKNILEDSAHP